MLNLSKKTEYGLMALAYLSSLKGKQWAKAADIARAEKIPPELLAKILSLLVKAGLADSSPGPSGGFRLNRPASSLSLAEVVRALEKKQGFTSCMKAGRDCHMIQNCHLRSPMVQLSLKVNKIFEETKLSDLITTSAPIRTIRLGGHKK